MSKQRYPEEFKIEAVKQITERGHKVADVSASGSSPPPPGLPQGAARRGPHPQPCSAIAGSRLPAHKSPIPPHASRPADAAAARRPLRFPHAVPVPPPGRPPCTDP